MKLISELINELIVMKEEHGDIPVIHTAFIENDDFDSSYEGRYITSAPSLELETLVEHFREDGTIAYTYFLKENPYWKNGRNKEIKVLSIVEQE
jgi:hypothetical protein